MMAAPQVSPVSPAAAHDPRANVVPARQRAYERLRDKIVAGQTPVGTVLDTSTLAGELEMSRTPVREALQQLLQEGLLERAQRRQMVVRHIAEDERREIFLMRDAVERAVVQEAASSLSDGQLDELRALIYGQRRASKAGDLDRFIELDERFHLSLADGAGLPRFRKVLSELRASIHVMGLAAVGYPGRMEQVAAEHELVLDALEKRASTRAASAMSEHLKATEEVLAGSGNRADAGRAAPRVMRRRDERD